jgi:hypothetical protein
MGGCGNTKTDAVGPPPDAEQFAVTSGGRVQQPPCQVPKVPQSQKLYKEHLREVAVKKPKQKVAV